MYYYFFSEFGIRFAVIMPGTDSEKRLTNGNQLAEGTSNDTEANVDKVVLQPYQYILSIPGKGIRSRLAQAFNFWLQIPVEKLREIEEIVEMLHNASLMVDDIEDSSVLRRGIPVAHAIYGVPLTLNAANMVYFLALERVVKLGRPEATKIFTEQLLELHRGQGMEIFWRDTNTCPTEEEYKSSTMRTTGGLFNLAIQLMQLFSERKDDFSRLTGMLGLYFQIRDDYINLKCGDYAKKKSFCEDLTEGKFNFCLIHSIRHGADGELVKTILRQRTTDVEVKKYCVELIEKSGSFEYTRAALKEIDDQAMKEISRVGGNDLLLQFLESLRVSV